MRIELDVSGLPPCEPLEQVLQGLKTLAPGDWLEVHHRQEPFPLYKLLEQGGFAWHTEPGVQADYRILIWREGDEAARGGAMD